MGRKSRAKKERKIQRAEIIKLLKDTDWVIKHPVLEDVYKVTSAATGRYVSLTLPGWTMDKILIDGPLVAARVERENWEILEENRIFNVEMQLDDFISDELLII